MNYEKWKQIVDEGYSSDVISFLQFYIEGDVIDEEHPKTKALISLMERKSLLFEGNVTDVGKSLYESCQNNTETPKIKIVDKFEDWWKIYPPSDAFSYEGRKFDGVQSKRKNKEKCKLLFKKAISEGLDPNLIIKATEYHIEQAKKLSLKRGTSQLTYISGSEIYLREKLYEPYIELCKDEIEEIEFKSNIL